MPDRDRLLEATLHRHDHGVDAVDRDDVEATGIGAFHHQQAILPIGPHPVRMLEPRRGLELGNLACLATLADLDAEQSPSSEGVDVEIAIRSDRDAIKAWTLAATEARVGRPD